MMNDLPPFELMSDETKDRFYRAGFTLEEIETFSHAKDTDGKPKTGLDFDSIEFDNMLATRYSIMQDFYQMGYSANDYYSFVEGLYATKAIKSPFDLLSAESAPKRSDLSIGEYNRRIERRDRIRSGLPNYFRQEVI